MPEESPATRAVPFLARLRVAGLSFFIYLVSFIVPALEFKVTGGEEWLMRGYEAAMLGPVALLEGNYAWLANVLYVPSLVFVLVRFWRTAMACALVGAGLGLHTLALVGRDMPADAAGMRRMMLVHFLAGFYFWLASMVAAAAGALWCRVRSGRPTG